MPLQINIKHKHAWDVSFRTEPKTRYDKLVQEDRQRRQEFISTVIMVAITFLILILVLLNIYWGTGGR